MPAPTPVTLDFTMKKEGESLHIDYTITNRTKASFLVRDVMVITAADPADLSARIALAVAADLARDPAALGAAMDAIPTPPAALTPPSPLAGLLFAELLFRRVDEGAARAWLAALPAESPARAAPDDALLLAVSARVRARFAAPAPRPIAR